MEPTNIDRQRVCFPRVGIFFYDFIKNDLFTLGMVFFFLYALNSKVRSFRGACSSHMFCLYISLVCHWPLQTNSVTLPCRPALIHTLSILLAMLSRGHTATASTQTHNPHFLRKQGDKLVTVNGFLHSLAKLGRQNISLPSLQQFQINRKEEKQQVMQCSSTSHGKCFPGHRFLCRLAASFSLSLHMAQDSWESFPALGTLFQCLVAEHLLSCRTVVTLHSLPSPILKGGMNPTFAYSLSRM